MSSPSRGAQDLRVAKIGTPFRDQVSALHRAIASGDEERTSQILNQSEFSLIMCE
jgi:hypothetical protein